MKYPLPAIVGRHTEWGPDAAGATSDTSPQGDPGGARRRPRLRFAAEDLRMFGSGDWAAAALPALKDRTIDADPSDDSLARD